MTATLMPIPSDAIVLRDDDATANQTTGNIDVGEITRRMRALATGPRLSMLLVDDDDLGQALIADRLEAQGIEVVRACNGREALALMEGRCFPVLLTDWQMPLMDGIELAREVRARGMDETYIIMLSVRDTTIDMERGYGAGIDDYVSKKLTDGQLLGRIHAAFQTAHLRHSLKEARGNIPTTPTRSAPDTASVTQVPTHGRHDESKPSAHPNDMEDTLTVQALSVMSAPSVLLVDDDELMLEHWKELIGAAGFHVRTTRNGAEALALLQEEFIPIIILDRRMPGMDGLALCRTIRQRAWPSYAYLVLLTSHDTESDVLLGFDAGADDYLSKRISSAQLIARLRTATRVLSLEHSLKTALADRRHMAMTDALTEAHNRRYFTRYLRGELKRARRVGSELSLLAIDIDHFKLVNDRYGHAAGDAVLQGVVRVMQKSLPREYDWLARIGGEEFAVVLPETDIAGATFVADKLRRAVEVTSIQTSAGNISVTISVGVGGLEAMPNREATTVETLLGVADRYLYKSKETGRNRVSCPKVSPANRSAPISGNGRR